MNTTVQKRVQRYYFFTILTNFFINFTGNNQQLTDFYFVHLQIIANENYIKMIKQGIKLFHARRIVLTGLFIVVLLFQTIRGGGELYNQHVYPFIAAILSCFSSLFPFSLSEVFYTLAITFIILYPIIAILRYRQRWRQILLTEVEFILWLYVWFYAAWGLNYSQPNFYERTSTRPAQYNDNTLMRFAKAYADSLNLLYTEINKKDEPLVRREITKAYRQLSQNMGIHAPLSSIPRVKTMLYTTLFSKAGISGTMGPFFNEFIVSGDLLPFEYPFTYAHELAHQLGVTNEGEANFYAFLACRLSKEKSVKFSGYIKIYSHVARAISNVSEEEYNRFLTLIRPEVKHLINQQRTHWGKLYSPTLGYIQGQLFEYYLRSNNVSAGRKSYSEVIRLIMSTMRSRQ